VLVDVMVVKIWTDKYHLADDMPLWVNLCWNEMMAGEHLLRLFIKMPGQLNKAQVPALDKHIIFSM
jgi:hypothetical protein